MFIKYVKHPILLHNPLKILHYCMRIIIYKDPPPPTMRCGLFCSCHNKNTCYVIDPALGCVLFRTWWGGALVHPPPPPPKMIFRLFDINEILMLWVHVLKAHLGLVNHNLWEMGEWRISCTSCLFFTLKVLCSQVLNLNRSNGTSFFWKPSPNDQNS